MLDLAKVSQQIAHMAAEDQLVWEDLSKRLDIALGRVQVESNRFAAFTEELRASKTSWLLAGMCEPLETAHALPAPPAKLTVVATDGSQIAPSHHEVASAFLVNVSSVVLPYGTGERAELSSSPTLFFRDEDLYLTYGGQRVQVTGEILGMRRNIMEQERLIEKAKAAQRNGHPVCGLADGSLIVWQLEGKPQDYQEPTLAQYLACLEAARLERIPLAGYISRPRSRDVINALRVSLCPDPVPNCDRCPYTNCDPLPCAVIEGLSDQRLFSRLLQPGERTQVFQSESRILESYGAHRIGFFYLHVGTEIVRIEIPQWVASDPELLDQVHAVAYTQADKGGGYPVALAEAHQQAVVRGSERNMFYEMVTTVLVRRGMRATMSPKNMRKRRMTV
ncbi:MAG: DNA double-strand break repair nuclease NurA [Candidatus Tectomicrobia bacterium]|nr:DNA double-strand break repair nuclease NurA [Candidatus Tectomicrobia bacterium]